MRYSNPLCTLRAELQAGAASMLWFTGGGDTKLKLPKAGNGNVFFPNKRVRFARADKAVKALQYHNQGSTDTNVCGDFT